MALYKCFDCGKEISDKADNCVYCGCPNYKGKYIQLCLHDNSITHGANDVAIACQILLDVKGIKNIKNINIDSSDNQIGGRWLRKNVRLLDKEIDMETISLLSENPQKDFELLTRWIKDYLKIKEHEEHVLNSLKKNICKMPMELEKTEVETDLETNILNNDNIQKILTETNLIIESIKSQALTFSQIRDRTKIQLTNTCMLLWLRKLVDAGIIIKMNANGKTFFQLKDTSDQELNIKLQKVALENEEIWQEWEKKYAEDRAKEIDSFMNTLKNEMDTYERNAIKCPNCSSKSVSKIGVVSRTVSVGFFGLTSSSIGKTYKCNCCGYKW